MSPSIVDGRIEWEGVDRGEVFSRTIDLQTWSGERLDVSVDPDAVGLVLRDDEIHAVLMGGNHAVHVLRPGEEPGDVDRREFASRMRVEVEDSDRVRRRTRHLPSDARLVHVAVGAFVFVEFGQHGPVLFQDRRRGQIALDVEGAARLAVTDPVRFHSSFLRNCEDLRGDDFERILASLVEAGIAEALEATTDDVESLEPDREALAAQVTGHLGPGMTSLGLAVEAVDLTRLETPTGSATVPTSAHADAPAPLATPTDRG